MNPLICQIRAIAKLCVTWTGADEYSTAELLSIRQAFAEALATVDDHLRWRRLERQQDEHEARLLAEYLTEDDMAGLFG